MAMIKLDDIERAEMGDEMYVHHTIEVDKGQEQIRIDKYLIDRLENISRSRIQNAIKANCIKVGDKEIKANYKVKPYDVISIVLPRSPDETIDILPEDIPLKIVYEDDSVMIINKPPNFVVHPGVGNHTGTLANALMHYFKKKGLEIVKYSDVQRPGIVHRIDKDTSGLMIIAKTEFALSHLAKQFYEHTIEREYFALVWGEPNPANGTIRYNIGRHETERMLMDAFEEGKEGKHAVTHFETLENLYYVSLIRCKLETGRTHQIRVHMKKIGHTLFNDKRYGGNAILKGTIFAKYRQFVENCFKIMPRQALHARVLGFEHPVTGEHMRFEVGLPKDFSHVLDKWRNYVNSRRELIKQEIDNETDQSGEIWAD
jgi:23S rRNA pseudouridine1911/1915/1917 synthase